MNCKPIRSSTVRLWATLFLLSLSILAGCDEPSARVRGRVTALNPATQKQEDVHFGRITFYSPETGDRSHAAIKDGAYVAEAVPIGSVRITITSFDLAFQEQGGPSGVPEAPSHKVSYDPASYFPIDPQYGSLKDTPLELEVLPGEQTHDLHLAGIAD